MNALLSQWSRARACRGRGNATVHTSSRGHLLTTTATMISAVLLSAASASPVAVGTTRQLFVDEHLIDRKQNVQLELHSPSPREIVLRSDQPWEGPNQA